MESGNQEIRNLIFFACTMFVVCGCSMPPSPPNVWNRIGETGKHTATALRTGYQDVVAGFSLAEFTITPAGGAQLSLVNFKNKGTLPSSDAKNVKTEMAKE